MFYLIGIDDTDNQKSPDTSSLGWQLGLKLETDGSSRLISVTRHKLLQNPALPGVRSNSAACLLVESQAESRRDLELACRQYLLHASAPGSDPGFALTPWSQVTPAVVTWGKQAKQELLDRQGAISLARQTGISIAGLTGNGNGVIGALAAIGLFHTGNDGRYAWLPGLRELQGIYGVEDLMTACPFDRLENEYGRRPISRDQILFGEKARPILRDGKALLLLKASEKGLPYEWETLSMEEIEALSS
jgi:hypothetical protein